MTLGIDPFPLGLSISNDEAKNEVQKAEDAMKRL